MASGVLRPITAVWRSIVDALAALGLHFGFYFKVLAQLPLSIARYWRHVLNLISEISFGSASLLAGGGTIGVVFAMSAVSSTQVGLEGYRGLDLLGLSPMTGLMSALVNTREIAPVVASIALAAKVGTGFTAQLGAMRISDEIDALESMAVPSLPFLVSTRMSAMFISVIPLYLIGLFASYLATSLSVIMIKGQSSGTYDYYFHLLLTPGDVVNSLAKALIFAMIITLVHCGYGYYASGGPEGVGRAAGRALRTSILAVALTDVLLTFAFWGLRPTLPGLGS